METVFQTNDLVKLSYIHHLLREAGIAAFTLDEHMAVVDGHGPMVPISVSVHVDQAERARQILREVEPG